MKMEHDVIVIGAGVAGLTAAQLLQQRGVKRRRNVLIRHSKIQYRRKIPGCNSKRTKKKGVRFANSMRPDKKSRQIVIRLGK